MENHVKSWGPEDMVTLPDNSIDIFNFLYKQITSEKPTYEMTITVIYA